MHYRKFRTMSAKHHSQYPHIPTRYSGDRLLQLPSLIHRLQKDRFPIQRFPIQRYAKSVSLVLGLLFLLPWQMTQANSPPSFERIENPQLLIDELFHFRVHPSDADQQVPGLLVQGLPEGAEFIDNRDGSRTFRWTPRDYQVGEHRVLFVAVDALDQSLRFSQEVFMQVRAQAGQAINTPDNNAPENTNAQAPVAPESGGTETVFSETVRSENITVDGNAFPVLEAPANVTAVAGESVAIRIMATDNDGAVPGLVAHALPAGAELKDNGDGTRSIVWTPDRWQTGIFEVVVVAIDAQRNDHRSQVKIRISVNEAASSIVGSVAETADNSAINNDGNNEIVATVEQPQQPTVTLSQPEANQPGADALQAADGNRAPGFTGLTDQVVSIGDTLRFIVAPTDPDGDVPGMFANRLPYNGSLRDNFDGTRTFVWAPYPVDEGDFWITFTAVDAKDSSLQTQQSIKITVENNGGFNFEPRINGINNPLIRAGDTLQQIVQPVDPDGDVPKLFVLNPPEGASFVDNGDGTRTLLWPTNSSHITEQGGVDEPHIVDFLTIDARDENLRDDHQLKISVVDPETRKRSGERLRVLAQQHDLAIGFAAVLNSSKLADAQMYLEIAAEEFNIVTPENSHTWGWIQPQRGQFNFVDADELAQYALDNGMALHGHPLIWHRQLPGWVQFMPQAEAEQIMYEHIDALVSRYRGKVDMWDVVNEALEEDGTYRQSVWFEAMQESYIGKAFRRARERDPEAVLIYNDYDVAWPGPKADGMYELVRRELEQGTPIDAVGFQMHFWTAFDEYDGLRQNLQRFADLGLDIYITEFDVAMTEDGQQEQQATVFQRIAEICLQQVRCKALQAWGYTDRYSWRYNHKPLLFNERYLAKPAYFAWQRALSQ